MVVAFLAAGVIGLASAPAQAVTAVHTAHQHHNAHHVNYAPQSPANQKAPACHHGDCIMCGALVLPGAAGMPPAIIRLGEACYQSITPDRGGVKPAPELFPPIDGQV